MTEHFGKAIRKLCKEKRISMINFSQQIGLTRVGLYAIFKRKDINTELLQKISIALKIPMSYWFEDDKEKKFEKFYYMDSDECGAKLSKAEKELQLLEEQIKMKDQLILSQQKLILILEKNSK